MNLRLHKLRLKGEIPPKNIVKAVVNREYQGIVVSKHEAYLINTNERSKESSRELVQVQDTNRTSAAINSSSSAVNLKQKEMFVTADKTKDSTQFMGTLRADVSCDLPPGQPSLRKNSKNCESVTPMRLSM